MYSVSCMDFKLCSYTLTPGTLPLYRQHGDAPPLTSTSRCVHGNGHTFDFIYLSTTPTLSCSCSIFSLCLCHVSDLAFRSLPCHPSVPSCTHPGHRLVHGFSSVSASRPTV